MKHQRYKDILEEYTTQDIAQAFFEMIGRDGETPEYYVGLLAQACDWFVEEGRDGPFDDEGLFDIEVMGWELGTLSQELEE